jgi:TrmH family RNA methyltransferase
MVEGFNMMERALNLGWRPEHLFATKRPHLWDDIQPYIVSEKVMAAMSGQNNPHDVLATFKQPVQTMPSMSGVWLALEDIRDPGNLGTILRTADATSAQGIILIGDCCDSYAAECVRASTGSIFAMPLVRMTQLEFLDFSKTWNGDIIGTAMDANADFRNPSTLPVLVILGSESRGLSQVISKACTKLVNIPMKQGVESLNIATAAALMLYQVSDTIK